MKGEWLFKKQKKNLILFFAGWGVDACPFKDMPTKDSDLLMMYDYRDDELPFSLSEICADYQSVTVVAWSLGVPMADMFCKKHNLKYDRALAVNGSAFPADDQYGIPVAVFDGTIESLSEDNLLRFYRRMCRPKKVFERFLKNIPKRSLEEVGDELRILRKVEACEVDIFQEALVSESDGIIPVENQINCWQKLGIPVRRISGSHFPFYSYSCWEDLIEA